MSVTPNHHETIKFLETFRPGGPWVLTAIHVDRRIETATFTDSEAALEWLVRYNDRNHYFMANPATRKLNKKGKKTDIKEMTHLHVDLDPRAGHDLEDERRLILSKLENPPGGLPKPSCVVFSGGGYQAYWFLEEPVPVCGDEIAAEEAARYNKQLQLLFGGTADSTHNVDRITRLPGTINWPDENKKKKGREVSLAQVVCLHPELKYPISTFTRRWCPRPLATAIRRTRRWTPPTCGD